MSHNLLSTFNIAGLSQLVSVAVVVVVVVISVVNEAP